MDALMKMQEWGAPTARPITEQGRGSEAEARAEAEALTGVRLCRSRAVFQSGGLDAGALLRFHPDLARELFRNGESEAEREDLKLQGRAGPQSIAKSKQERDQDGHHARLLAVGTTTSTSSTGTDTPPS